LGIRTRVVAEHSFGVVGRPHERNALSTVRSGWLSIAPAGSARTEDNAATIFVAGRKATAPLPFTTSLSPLRRWAELPPATVVAALSAVGARKWTLELPPIDVTVADVAVARPWLALGTRSGQVYVIDAVRGGILGVVEAQGAAEVAWAGNPPLLVVAAGAALKAFHVSAP
jgi:hypothetical protein